MKRVKLLKVLVQPTFVIIDDDEDLEEVQAKAVQVNPKDLAAFPERLAGMAEMLQRQLNGDAEDPGNVEATPVPKDTPAPNETTP